jgi:pathogenesis-related protein 1
MLAAHNAVRATQAVRPLTWSDKLAAHAQDWAETLLARDEFMHRPKSPYGENLFAIEGASASPEKVVEAWASESRDYDYATNKCRKVCGHYTQLVWAGTKTVGCGVARNSRREIWVCNYDPPGNYVGKRPY